MEELEATETKAKTRRKMFNNRRCAAVLDGRSDLLGSLGSLFAGSNMNAERGISQQSKGAPGDKRGSDYA